MSDTQETLSLYVSSFKLALAKCETREDCIQLWRAQEKARDDLCIVPTSYTFNCLHEMWTNRGRELAAKEKVA